MIDLPDLWFALVFALLGTFLFLDGFDFGVGALFARRLVRRLRGRGSDKIDQRLADFGDVADGGVQLADHAALRCGHIDDRLGRLHRHQPLAERHRVALGDVPLDDFGLLQALAQIGQVEGTHANSRVSVTASRMRGTLGM